MFSAIVALNRNVSCGTKPICRRRSRRIEYSRRSMPSSSTAPEVGSISRGIRLTSVLLPAPVCPTIATVAPAGMRKIDAVQATVSPKSTRTSRNSISPRARGPGAPAPAARRCVGFCRINLVDARQRRRAALHQVHHPAQRDHGPDQHAHVGVEHDEAAERDAAGQHLRAAHPQHDQKVSPISASSSGLNIP